MPGLFAIHPRTPFVGRAAELARLSRGLHTARAGRGALVVLVGEPGIGKTRLTEELADSVGAAGMTVLRGAATRAT